jgi:hypothetical protein
MTLEPGEKTELDTRVDGGPVFMRDPTVEDAVAIDGHGGELYADEIRQLAEAVGFEVSDP